VIGVHGRVHGHHGALDRRELALQQDPVEPDADDGRRRMVAQRRAAGEVHLLGTRHAHAYVAVPVGGNRAAGHDAPGDVDHLVGQVLIHG
jgi:hypothetical protein